MMQNSRLNWHDAMHIELIWYHMICMHAPLMICGWILNIWKIWKSQEQQSLQKLQGLLDGFAEAIISKVEQQVVLCMHVYRMLCNTTYRMFGGVKPNQPAARFWSLFWKPFLNPWWWTAEARLISVSAKTERTSDERIWCMLRTWNQRSWAWWIILADPGPRAEGNSEKHVHASSWPTL